MAATVVFDTNILFSAAGWKGPPFRCVELARQHQIQAITCWEILSELSEKLSTKLHFDENQIDDALLDVINCHSVVQIPRTIAASRDPDDDAVLECALIGNAKYIVTGDDDLLVLKEFRGVTILKAAEFLKRWEDGRIVGSTTE